MNEKPQELAPDAEELDQSPEDDAAECGNATEDALEDGDEDLLLEYDDEDLEGGDGAAEPEEWVVTWPLHLESAEFDQLVSDVMDGLPEEWTPILENMAVVVENEPPDDEVPEGEGEVFGAFRAAYAVPFLGGLAGQAASAPPEVALFQGPLERASASVDELRERVHATLVHEIGRRFGYGDEDFADDEEEYDESEDEAEDALEGDEALEGNEEPGEQKDAG